VVGPGYALAQHTTLEYYPAPKLEYFQTPFILGAVYLFALALSTYRDAPRRAGGLMVGAGVGLLVYSYARLPKQPAPAVEQRKREWTETSLVEATGCNMGLPGNVAATPAPAPMPAAAPAAPANDVTARLQKLDALKASGAITDAEYQKKRKEIIDGI
jgi:hypothetical protein